MDERLEKDRARHKGPTDNAGNPVAVTATDEFTHTWVPPAADVDATVAQDGLAADDDAADEDADGGEDAADDDEPWNPDERDDNIEVPRGDDVVTE